jgi:hypothetical protein
MNTDVLSSGMLVGAAEAARLIASGAYFMVAADEAILRGLPKGHWVGGTIPYFMGQSGGECSRDKVFITPIDRFGGKPQIRMYDATDLSHVCSDGPANGYSLIIIPAFSQVHSLYARNAPGFEDMFVKPIVGWISGVHLDDLGKAEPAVFDGTTGRLEHDAAIVMHVPLPEDRYAQVDIINGMEPSDGDAIRFNATGFSAGDCMINGKPANLAEYLTSRGSDTSLPLVADYSGAMVNVSIRAVDQAKRQVEFYAPVFEDMEYRLAKPPGTLPAIGPDEGGGVNFSCNCILNYLYGKLEGQRTGRYTGPMTFGEIAFLLLNQTLVHLTVCKV